MQTLDRKFIKRGTETRVCTTNIDKQVGYGAYWVRITYSDDSQKQYNATDQLHNADSNTYIELVGKSNIDANKTIKSIEVVVAYELFAGAPAYLVFGGRNTQIGVANTPSILHIKLLITIRQTGKGDAMRRRFPFVGKEREVSFMLKLGTKKIGKLIFVRFATENRNLPFVIPSVSVGIKRSVMRLRLDCHVTISLFLAMT